MLLLKSTLLHATPHIEFKKRGKLETRTKYMALVDKALESGISSFFLDKASTSTKANGTQLCNHVCANLSKPVGEAWDAGHLEVLLDIQAKSVVVAAAVRCKPL